MTGKFKVIKASAGSGKTYTLVKEYLQLALSTEKADYYRHILAITFTNAAAAEMKDRVLNTLREIANNDERTMPLAGELAAAMALSIEQLKQRAGSVYAHMLHHYSLLSITTIDSFTHRLVRTFARDLQIRQDFQVQMDTGSFIEQMADSCMAAIGEDAELTAYIKQYALEQLAEESDWRLRDSIIVFIKDMLDESAHYALQDIAHLGLEDFAAIRRKLYAQVIAFEESVSEQAQQVLSRYYKEGLTNADFYNGGRGNLTYLRALGNGEIKEITSTFYNCLGKNKWASGKISKIQKQKLESITPWLAEKFTEIIGLMSAQNLSKYYLQKQILKYLFVMGLMKRLHELAALLKQEQNVLLIKDFHELINVIVSDNEAPFIYERLGARYRHILFDEFQDTSTMQWSNILPLLSNGLSENNLSLVVGDGKQSIYRWRGARAEQFVQLPEVPVAGQGFVNNTILNRQFQPQSLQRNFRSSFTIVSFNNRFYDALKDKMPEVTRSYEDHRQQAVKQTPGLVNLKIIKTTVTSEATEKIQAMVQSIVKQCLADGYHGGDIAVLCRKSAKESSPIAAGLQQAGIAVVTRESFLLNHSPKVKAVMGYLAHSIDPGNHFAAVECARCLCQLNPMWSFEEFVNGFIQRNGHNKEITVQLDTWLKKVLGNSFQSEAENIFDLITKLIRYFGFSIDVYLEFLLDNARKQSMSQGFSRQKFLRWWQSNKDSTYIASAPDQSAVQVMTIHQSKGLQFPVVIYPRFDTRSQEKRLWIKTNEEEFGIRTALVSSKFKSAGDKTLIPEELSEESERETLDELNLCYVATTRPEERLYMIIESRYRGQNKLNDAIETVVENNFSDAKITEGEWQWGEVIKTQKPVPVAREMLKYQLDNTNQFKLRNTTYKGEEQLMKAEYGKALHYCMSLIQTKADLNKAIETTLISFAQPVDGAFALKLNTDVSKLINDPKYAECFDGFESVLNERELITTDGRTLRPDRICIMPDSIRILDYKTGAEKPHHREQMEEYVQVLRETSDKEVSGEVIYIE